MRLLSMTAFSARWRSGANRIIYKGVITHRLLSNSLLGLPYRVLNINHKKELLIGAYDRPMGKRGTQEALCQPNQRHQTLGAFEVDGFN